jgi:hypothetical protein
MALSISAQIFHLSPAAVNSLFRAWARSRPARWVNGYYAKERRRVEAKRIREIVREMKALVAALH